MIWRSLMGHLNALGLSGRSSLPGTAPNADVPGTLRNQPFEESATAHLEEAGGRKELDPFFSDWMKSKAYRDFPDAFSFHRARRSDGSGLTQRSAVLVSHDLSASGAPRALFEIAAYLRKRGFYVLVISPRDGYYRSYLQDAGVDVLVDGLVLAGGDRVTNLAADFDVAFANTVVPWRFVASCRKSAVPCVWYLHEAELISRLAETEPDFASSGGAAVEIWAGSPRSKLYAEHLWGNVHVIEYGSDAMPEPEPEPEPERRVTIGVFGSYEHRKGQDLAADAYMRLPEDLRQGSRLMFYGRVLEEGYFAALEQKVATFQGVDICDEVLPAQCRQIIANCDIVLCSSRDEPFSFVCLDALAASRIVVCSKSAGISDYLENGKSAFIAPTHAAKDLSSALESAMRFRSGWPEIGQAGYRVFAEQFSMSALYARLDARLESITEKARRRGGAPR